MTATYAILTTVTLQHDYYADGRCPDFELAPTAETAAVMKGLGILAKTVGNTLILLVQVKADGSTYLPLPQGQKLSFYLELANSSFMNYTAVTPGNNTVFYFTNLYHTQAGGTGYLNHPVPAFNAATAYGIGDTVQAGGSVYEAVKPVAPGSHAPGDAAFWHQRSGLQYVHSADLMPVTDGAYQMATAPAKVFDIQVFAWNSASGNFDARVMALQQNFHQDVSEITIPLQALRPARYRVLVNGASHVVYVDKTAVYRRVAGLLEIYHHFPPADDFGLVDGAGVPKGLDYVIRFPNRLAIWKYLTRTTNVTAVENTAVPGQFVAALQPRQFVSVVPLPLKQMPVKTLQVKNGAIVLASRLANPSPDRMATFTDGAGNTYFCAEMYLNY